MSLQERSSSRTIIAVDLDYFYAQLEEVRKPELKESPVVVCVFSGRTEDSGAVSTSNYIARRLGVKSGISISLAKRILQNNPKAKFITMDKEYYDSVSERIMHILRSFSAKFEQVSIDEAYLDVTDRANGNIAVAREIALQIKNEVLQDERLTCSVGIGPNKLIAKMAVDSNKPDGLTVIAPAQISEFLNPLPVGKLFGVGPRTEMKLKGMGIETIGDLSSSDETALSKEFGKNLGPQLKNAACGIDDDEVRDREPEQFSRIITLKHDAQIFDFVSELSSLGGDISNKLVAAGLLCKSVGIIAITSKLKIKNRAKTLEIPTNSEKQIVAIASELFVSYFEEQSSVEADSSVRRVGIRVSNLVQMKGETPIGNPTLSEFF